MPRFEIGLKKAKYGHAIVYAKDEKEARKKLDQGQAHKITMYEGEDTLQQDCKDTKTYEGS